MGKANGGKILDLAPILMKVTMCRTKNTVMALLDGNQAIYIQEGIKMMREKA